MRRQSPFHQNAFTLIELLVVVAIIGILSTIALVNLSQARQRAETAQCQANLKTLGTALATYRLDHDAFPLADGVAGRASSPQQSDAGNGPAAGGSWDGVPWELVERRYLDHPEALYCPSLRKRHGDDQEHFRYAYNHSTMSSGGSQGGATDLEASEHDQWLCRCLYLPASHSFHPGAGHVFPHGHDPDADRYRRDVMENVLFTNLRVELRNGRKDYETDRLTARR